MYTSPTLIIYRARAHEDDSLPVIIGSDFEVCLLGPLRRDGAGGFFVSVRVRLRRVVRYDDDAAAPYMFVEPL